LNVQYKKSINFATIIIVKDLFKDDKKLISHYFLTVNQYHTIKKLRYWKKKKKGKKKF